MRHTKDVSYSVLYMISISSEDDLEMWTNLRSPLHRKRVRTCEYNEGWEVRRWVTENKKENFKNKESLTIIVPSIEHDEQLLYHLRGFYSISTPQVFEENP